MFHTIKGVINGKIMSEDFEAYRSRFESSYDSEAELLQSYASRNKRIGRYFTAISGLAMVPTTIMFSNPVYGVAEADVGNEAVNESLEFLVMYGPALMGVGSVAYFARSAQLSYRGSRQASAEAEMRN
jgi:hypothetical protein